MLRIRSKTEQEGTIDYVYNKQEVVQTDGWADIDFRITALLLGSVLPSPAVFANEDPAVLQGRS